MDKKVAIITGGSRGVGADLAKLCAEKGWNMTITCSNSIDDARNVAKECEKLGSEVLVLQADVCLLYTSPSPRDSCASRMPSSA